MCTKSYYCSNILKTLRFWPFMERQIDHLKKMFWKLSKTPNPASSSFECVSKFTTAHVFWRRSKLWVFWKKRFFSKKPCNVFKNTKHGYFLLECLSKIIIAYANSKRSKLEFSSKKLMFFCEQILERLQEHFLAFFIENACETFILLRKF